MKFFWSLLFFLLILQKIFGQVVSYTFIDNKQLEHTCSLYLFEGNSKFESNLISFYVIDNQFVISPVEYLEEGVLDKIETIQWSWEYVNQSKDVMGFSCKQAISDFNGRTWVAWYTDTLYGGPWKSRGLPGIILELHDTDSLFHFTASEFSPDVVEISPPELKNPISYEEYVERHKIFRQSFNEVFSDDSLIKSKFPDPRYKVKITVNFDDVLEPDFFN